MTIRAILVKTIILFRRDYEGYLVTRMFRLYSLFTSLQTKISKLMKFSTQYVELHHMA